MPANVLTSANAPIKIWSPIHEVESSALDQLRNTASLPFIFKHVAVMPDVHYGIGATVGSVVATKGAIVPACVGVDIGCGMMAALMPFKAKRLPDNLQGLFDAISKAVPVGMDMHNHPLLQGPFDLSGYEKLPEKVLDDPMRVVKQMGTLGGGNHFIEVCLDLDDNVWVMLHSGSRGIGNKIGNYYIDQAKKIMDAEQVKLVDPNLAYLHDGSELFNEYWRDLQWAQRYAMKNREVMMKLVMRCIADVIFGDEDTVVTPELMVNCHHNYAEREEHYGENVIVTRKGAVRARVGDMGIIPGSMGTRSYIVEGLGNSESFCSCSHGAGRVMSRGKAKKAFTIADAEEQTKGIVCKKDSTILDELPLAYKSIDSVMENQKDLVKIVATLKQVLCVKG
jgi:tRNA-splicing ligase RtcB